MRVCLVALLLFSYGCSYFVSWDDISQPLVGEPLSDITKYESWNTPDEIKILPDGQTEYKYHLPKLDPSCIHYWLVNEQGIITGYRYEGRCRPVG